MSVRPRASSAAISAQPLNAGVEEISGPLGDATRAKLSAHSERRDGFVRNLFDGSDDIGKIDVDAVRAH